MVKDHLAGDMELRQCGWWLEVVEDHCDGETGQWQSLASELSMGEATHNVHRARIHCLPPFVGSGHAKGIEAPRRRQTTPTSLVVVTSGHNSP